MNLTIRWKLILSITIPMLLVYGTLLAWEHRTLTETARRDVQHDVAERARMAAWVIDHSLYSIQQMAESTATGLGTRPLPEMGRGQITIGGGRVGWVYATMIVVDPTAPPITTGLGQGAGPGPGPGRGGPLFGPGALVEQLLPRKSGRPRKMLPLPDKVDFTTSEWFQKARTTKKTVWSKPFKMPDAEKPPGSHTEGTPGKGEKKYERSAEHGEPPVVVACASPVIYEGQVRAVVAMCVNVQDLQRLDAFPNATPADRKKQPSAAAGAADVPGAADEEEDDEPRKVNWSPLAVAPNGFVILDQDGRMISHKNPALIERDSVFALAKKYGIDSIVKAGERARAGESGVVRVTGLNDVIPDYPPDTFHWLAFAPIPTTKWTFAAAVPEGSVMEPIDRRLETRGTVLLGGLVLMIGVVTLASIRMSRPIERMARAVTRLAAGNLDVQVHGVKNRDEIGQLARSFNHMVLELRRHVAALTAESAARGKVESELMIARQIQTDLLPSTFPPFPDRPEFDLHAVNVPARQVAGDFFDFFFAPNGTLTVIVADVSGKGVPAALFMAITRTIVRNLAMEGLGPSAIVTRANAMLVADSTANGMFVTLVILQYDPATGRIVYANAGHPLPYRCTVDRVEPFGEVTAPLLGVTARGEMGPFEERVDQLAPGESLVLYTDGLTEARSPEGRLLRADGAERMIAECPRADLAAFCGCVMQQVDAYQAGQRIDDVTVLALRRNS